MIPAEAVADFQPYARIIFALPRLSEIAIRFARLRTANLPVPLAPRERPATGQKVVAASPECGGTARAAGHCWRGSAESFPKARVFEPARDVRVRKLPSRPAPWHQR